MPAGHSFLDGNNLSYNIFGVCVLHFSRANVGTHRFSDGFLTIHQCRVPPYHLQCTVFNDWGLPRPCFRYSKLRPSSWFTTVTGMRCASVAILLTAYVIQVCGQSYVPRAPRPERKLIIGLELRPAVNVSARQRKGNKHLLYFPSYPYSLPTAAW
jgi:hypothetical protein